MKSPLISRHACFVLLSLVVASFPGASAQPKVSAQPGESTQPNRVEQLATQAVPAQAVTAPALAQIDRVRLREVFWLGDSIGDRVWPGWSKAPFSVLLVTPEYEFLVRYAGPQPEAASSRLTPKQKAASSRRSPKHEAASIGATAPADFTNLGYDTLLKTDVYYRKRIFPTHFLATFPAVSGSMISTIVVGQAENTSAKTSARWVITVLHEHFHQLQDSQPNFYSDVNALNLARGDQTGMWMLNYAFPYERIPVQEQFATMSKLLAAATEAPKRERAKRVREYLEARRKFQEMLAPDDYKYFSFQFWKEGIARYTEYRVAEMAAAKFRVSKEFRALKDYQSFAEVARTTRERIFQQLATQKLAEAKREVVYSFGAAEGLLLDQINPGWRRRYFVEKFDLGKLYP